MSVSTGRMSRRDAQHILRELQPAIREFINNGDSPPEILREAIPCEGLRADLQDLLDRGLPPEADTIRALRTRVAALQADRLLRSEAQPFRATSAAVITLYGISDNSVECAASLAEQQLGCSVRLQDSSHVRTATLQGTRYIFTSHQP